MVIHTYYTNTEALMTVMLITTFTSIVLAIIVMQHHETSRLGISSQRESKFFAES